MPPTDTLPATDILRPDTSAFLEQQAAILLEAPDNDTMVRRLLAAALRRISELEQQLAAATPPGRPHSQPSLRHPILTLLREQPDGLTRRQIEEALARRGLGDTLQRMVRDALLVRTGEKTFVAYSQKCTHLSCAVVPQPDKNRFYCPCHEGSFDLATGAPIAGPPQRPLPRINLELRSGGVYATGVEVKTI